MGANSSNEIRVFSKKNIYVKNLKDSIEYIQHNFRQRSYRRISQHSPNSVQVQESKH